MYKNLEAEIIRAGLSNNEMAEMLGITRSNFSQKLNKKVSWKLNEMVMIQTEINKRLAEDYTLDYLFQERD